MSIVPLTVPLLHRKIAIDINPSISLMNDFSKILDSPEYFFCEKTNCKLRVAVCIQRQKANKKTSAFAGMPFMICEDCPQGLKNMNPTTPKGEIMGEDKQLTEAVNLETEAQQPHLCKECGEKPRMGSSPYCASCMAIRGNKARALQKAADKLKKEKRAKGQGKSETARNVSDTALKIEFGSHADILREVEALADQEIRPVECQIIYMLKQQLTRNAHQPPV